MAVIDGSVFAAKAIVSDGFEISMTALPVGLHAVNRTPWAATASSPAHTMRKPWLSSGKTVALGGNRALPDISGCATPFGCISKRPLMRLIRSSD
jgi:carbonic anhydrase/acetyltransferase-like protein (isoleucine patch superfamily)